MCEPSEYAKQSDCLGEKHATSLIAIWTFAPDDAGSSTVLPDGCRDLIMRVSNSGEPRWFVSALVDSAVEVAYDEGERFVGFRCHPAAIVDEPALLATMRRRPEADAATVLGFVDDHVRIDPGLSDVIASLAEARRVAEAARNLGVTQRALQRLVISATGRSPGYWRSLARARRAGLALADGLPLSELAVTAGYADQAHMTREFKRWFKTSPARFRRRPDLLAQLREPAYVSAAIGVQTSMSTPSASAM